MHKLQTELLATKSGCKMVIRDLLRSEPIRMDALYWKVFNEDNSYQSFTSWALFELLETGQIMIDEDLNVYYIH